MLSPMRRVRVCLRVTDGETNTPKNTKDRRKITYAVAFSEVFARGGSAALVCGTLSVTCAFVGGSPSSVIK